MRIFLLGINYHPELTGIGKYTGELATWLAEQNQEVIVATAPPYYPEWKVHPGYSPFRFRQENIEGVTVIRCPLWVPKRPSGMARILHLASFAISSSLAAIYAGYRYRPDLIIVIEPPLFCSPTAILLARFTKGRSWLHIQDLEVDAAFELNILKSERLRHWALRIESTLMRNFDRVSTISDAMLKRVGQKGVPLDRLVLFGNWADLTHLSPDPKAGLQFKESQNIPKNQRIALYSGNLGEKQGVEIVVEAAQLLRHRSDLTFIICGSGAAEIRLREIAKGLPNVIFLPLQPKEVFHQMLNAADVHLLPQRHDAADLVMPSKLTGILAVGGLVVATALQETQVGRVVQAVGGYLTIPGDAEAFAETVVSAIDDPMAAEKARRLATQYCKENLSKDIVLDRFFNHAKRLVNGKSQNPIELNNNSEI